MNRIRRNELRGQNGSAYLLAIMVLLILTIVGLSVALTTQTEMQIGENERQLRRSFYSANAGIALATAKALVVPDMRCINLDFVEESNHADLQVRNRLALSPFQPIHQTWCNLCQVNQDGEYKKINHAVAARATRVAWEGDADNPPARPLPLAQERLSVMVSFQPWRTQMGGPGGAVSSIVGDRPDGGWTVSGQGADNSLCGIQEGL